MERREILKYGATGLAGMTTGYVLLDRSTDNASAAVSVGQLNISDAQTKTQDGTISKVKANVSGSWEYDLPSGKNPQSWVVSLNVTDSNTSALVAQDSGEAKYLLNNGDYSLSGSITKTDLFASSDFAAPQGKKKTVTLGFVLLFEVLNGSDDQLARAQLEDTASVAVTHEGYQASDYGSVGGDGGLTIVD